MKISVYKLSSRCLKCLTIYRKGIVILHGGKKIWVLCLSICLYGKWDGIFAMAGHLP